MRRVLAIAWTGLVALRLHPLRSVVSIAALSAVLLPYLVGLSLSQGLATEAEDSARFGADLHVSGSQFGRPVPVPAEVTARLSRIEGVTAVVPRIVGEVILGKDHVHTVVVGMPADRLPFWSASVDGRLPQSDSPHELVVGTAVAQRLNLTLGSTLLPFYHNDSGERLSRVVGIFKPDAPPWQANLILTTFATAETIFDQEGLATDVLVYCRPGYQAAVSSAIEREQIDNISGKPGTIRLRVVAREDLLALLPRGLLHREGIFNLFFLLAFVICILVLLVTSGLGLAERRREIGILKATGWQTDEILLRGVAESVALSLAAAGVSLLLAWIWLKLFNGMGLAGLFLDGADWLPSFTVPFRLTPVPVLLGFVVSLAVVLTGTLYSSWRAAITPPRDAMR